MTSVRASARPLRLLAIGAGAGVLLSTLGASGAFAAEPFPQDIVDAPYPSNPEVPYWLIMDQFTELRDDADVVAFNDRTTVEVNRFAEPEQVERAIVDQYDDMSISMHDALGAELGALYEAGRLAGELPKVDQMLRKSGGMVGVMSSSNPTKEFFEYPRPYVRAEQGVPELQGLQYRDKPGGDAWNSRSGAFPSGHTSQAYWQAVSLAVMLPELAPQILARASEAGHNRIVMGAHYPLDVMGGRMMGSAIVAHRMADEMFLPRFEETAAELRDFLETACGAPLGECIAEDQPYLDDAASLEIYEERMTYGFERVGEAGQPVTVPEDAEVLLLTSHPELDAEQRRQVLALTAIDSGYPLDQGAEGSWQRLDLAAAMGAEVVVAEDGTVSLAGEGEAPGAEEPGAEQPGAEQPGAEQPDAEQPGGRPGAEQPDAGTAPAQLPAQDATDDRSAASASADRGELSATGASIAAPAAAGVLALLLGAVLIGIRRLRASARS